MNIKQLYLDTADYIERYPGLYDYDEIKVPKCGSPGCILGIIGMKAGIKAGEVIKVVSKNILNIKESSVFYLNMSKAETILFNTCNEWERSPQTAVTCLRYLAEHEPAELETNFARDMMAKIMNEPIQNEQTIL